MNKKKELNYLNFIFMLQECIYITLAGKCTPNVYRTLRYSCNRETAITTTDSTRRRCARSHRAAPSRYSTIKNLLNFYRSLSITASRPSTNSRKCAQSGRYNYNNTILSDFNMFNAIFFFEPRETQSFPFILLC